METSPVPRIKRHQSWYYAFRITAQQIASGCLFAPIGIIRFLRNRSLEKAKPNDKKDDQRTIGIRQDLPGNLDRSDPLFTRRTNDSGYQLQTSEDQR